MVYKLERERDGFLFIGDKFASIKHKEEGNEATQWPPKVGESTITYNDIYDYWQTTLVTKILSLKENVCKFETENNVYTLTKN